MSFSLYLNDDSDVQQTTLLGKEFQALISLSQKKYFLHPNENYNNTGFTYYLLYYCTLFNIIT